MEQYPGQNTEFFIIVNGATVGPVKGLKGLFDYPFVVDTPVWYDGLDDWMPAALAPLTAPLFQNSDFVKKVMSVEPTEPSQEKGTEETHDDTPADLSANEGKESAPEIHSMPEGTPPPIGEIRPRKQVHPYAQSFGGTQSAQTVSVAVRKPSSFLGWSIVVTVLCSLIGIVAIIYSTKVNSKFLRGDIEGAQRCSDRAQWWIAISITTGLILMVANIMTGGIL